MNRLRICVCLGLVAGLGGCIDRKAPSEGQVFAGPINLVLHEDISPKSKAAVVVHHGERLDVVQQRRRLYRLRTKAGAMGWTDERNLMSSGQMDALRQLEEKARTLPSQGVGSTYETLNMHTEPQRFSPSFVQVREGEKFDVIAHQISSRAEPQRRVLVKATPRPVEKGKHAESKRVPPPPTPLPPPLPRDWQELSEEREPKTVETKPDSDADSDKEPQQPQPTDDWTLIRTARGTAGWVLTNRIFLAIPDEVAQYAEGRRIVAYFSLGRVHDGDRNEDKDIWLWATVHAGRHPYDFDSFRVFSWNAHRHRYETTYINRSMEGFLPVLVATDNGRATFSVCLTNDDDVRVRRKYGIFDHLVHLVDEEPCAVVDIKGLIAEPPAAATPEEKKPETITEKLENKLSDVKKHVLGK